MYFVWEFMIKSSIILLRFKEKWPTKELTNFVSETLNKHNWDLISLCWYDQSYYQMWISYLYRFDFYSWMFS
jgi:hypothetical protein